MNDMDVELTEAFIEWLDEYVQEHALDFMEEKFHSTLHDTLTQYAYEYVGISDWVNAQHKKESISKIIPSIVSSTYNDDETDTFNEELAEDVEQAVEEALQYFFRYCVHPRSIGVEWKHDDTDSTSEMDVHLETNLPELDVDDSGTHVHTFLNPLLHNPSPSKVELASRIAWMRAQPQPAQRTPEWYAMRTTLLSASNIYKALGSECAKNALIYEKCKGYQDFQQTSSGTASVVVHHLSNDNGDRNDSDQESDTSATDTPNATTKKTVYLSPVVAPTTTSSSVAYTPAPAPALFPKCTNTETAMHWGVKYEPVTAEWYEHTYQCELGEFGCIRHATHSFLGASPDGVVVSPQSPRYGRMIEIKNVVSRKLTGVPKKEYWVQMQMQMEVCNLEHCDFIETRFTEYENINAFLQDAPACDATCTDNCFDDANAWKNEFRRIDRTATGKWKGVMLHFFNPATGDPVYVRKPFSSHLYFNQMMGWRSAELEKYTTAPYMYTFVSTIYWKLEQVSEVVVQRNRDWFRAAFPAFDSIWKIIETERTEGFEHRGTKPRIAKSATTATSTTTSISCMTADADANTFLTLSSRSLSLPIPPNHSTSIFKSVSTHSNNAFLALARKTIQRTAEQTDASSSSSRSSSVSPVSINTVSGSSSPLSIPSIVSSPSSPAPPSRSSCPPHTFVPVSASNAVFPTATDTRKIIQHSRTATNATTGSSFLAFSANKMKSDS